MPLFLLLRLQRVQLPVCVTDPEEVHHVSVLVATGLIEAEFTCIRLRAEHCVERVATVIRITEEGLIEVATVRKSPAFAQPVVRFGGGLRLM